MMEQTAATIHVGVYCSAAVSSASAIVRTPVLDPAFLPRFAATPGARARRFCRFLVSFYAAARVRRNATGRTWCRARAPTASGAKSFQMAREYETGGRQLAGRGALVSEL